MRPRPSTLPESTSRPSFFLSAPAIAPRTVCGCQESASAGPSRMAIRCVLAKLSNRHGTDPYAWWCGRGGVARRPPIPISLACDIP